MQEGVVLSVLCVICYVLCVMLVLGKEGLVTMNNRMTMLGIDPKFRSKSKILAIN